MESERLVALEQALAEIQAKDANTQHKLDLLISRLTSSEPYIPHSNPSPTSTPPAPKVHGLKPALPSEFDGDRTKGVAFLNSCQTYIRLCPHSFQDEQAKIVWAMSYMKSGRAAKWTARIFRWEDEPENVNHRFVDWEDFRDEFKKEFCPAYADSAAINRLESMAYFQKSRSVDCYLDEFLDLIVEAGYSDPKTIVVKFRRGLNPEVQNAIATMTSGRPSDMVPTQWYSAARTIDQNQATNEAFRSSYRTPSTAPTQNRLTTFSTTRFPAPERNTHFQRTPTPGNPVPMDIDAGRKTQSLPFSCYRCGKAGHKAPDCPTQFDIRTLSIDELQSHLEDRLAELDAKHPEPPAEVEQQEEVVEDFPRRNK